MKRGQNKSRDALQVLIRKLVKAEIANAFKGAGDPDDYEEIEERLRRARAAVLRGIDRIASPPQMTDAQIRNEWKNCGGEMHGPNVETVTMPEDKYIDFRRSLGRMQWL